MHTLVARTFLGGVSCAFLVIGGSYAGTPSSKLGARVGESPRLEMTYAALPLAFEPDPQETGFVARGVGYAVRLSPTAATFALPPAAAAHHHEPDTRGPHIHAHATAQLVEQAPSLVQMQFRGAAPTATPEALEALPGTANYYLGSDPDLWRTGVPLFGKVRYRDIYPGVDLVYYGTQGNLEYDLVLGAGADPSTICLTFDGAAGSRLDEEGGLLIEGHAGPLHMRAPTAYQTRPDGLREAVQGSYVVAEDASVRFALAAYDQNRPLIIDPVLAYATYLGGGYDWGEKVAMDSTGAAYVVGQTYSYDFPTTPGAPQRTYAGNGDVFVSKLDPTGSTLVYSTYLGGDQSDIALAVTVDGTQHAYVAGETNSANFPTTQGAYQRTYGGGGDVFVAKLRLDGTLDYSTYLGGSEFEHAHGIAVDGAGTAFVTGHTASPTFPTTPGAYQRTLLGAEAIFVTALNSTGSDLVASTLVSASIDDHTHAIALGPQGYVYVAGHTQSPDFPTTPGAFRTTYGQGPMRALVVKLPAGLTNLTYSTLLGGSGFDVADSIAVDADGNAHVAGWTTSADFPTTTGALQRSFGGGTDGFVVKVNPTGSGLVYGTYMGGPGDDGISEIRLDGARNAYVVGSTTSSNLPATTDAFQRTMKGIQNAFVAKLNPSGSALGYLTYLGGTTFESGASLATDSAGNVVVTGETSSPDFPVTGGAFSRSLTGNLNAYVARIAATLPSGTIGGRGFGLTAGSVNGALLTWTGGTVQTGYAPARVGQTSGTQVMLAQLGATETSYNDQTPLAEPSCYSVTVFNGEAVIGRSDLLCISRTRSDAFVPPGFTIRLNQSNTASLTWGAPGGQLGYSLMVYPDGRAPQAVDLPASATSANFDTAGVLTCFTLVANRGSLSPGTTDTLCGVPGSATVSAEGRPLSASQVQAGVAGKVAAGPAMPGLRLP